MKQIEVLLADDYPLLRVGIHALVKEMAEVRIVADTSEGREPLDLIRKHRPHVVLIEIEMDRVNGLETIAQVTKEFPNLPVVVLSTTRRENYLYQAMQAGAAGFLVKTASAAELERAIKAVAKGKTYISLPSTPSITNYSRKTSDPFSLRRLTPRQREVVKLIAEGKSTKQSALILNISDKTIESHRRELMERLDIHNTAGLVRYAINAGLIQLEDWLRSTAFDSDSKGESL
jgi:DNA-binding NarL/FixJ family response regulator